MTEKDNPREEVDISFLKDDTWRGEEITKVPRAPKEGEAPPPVPRKKKEIYFCTECETQLNTAGRAPATMLCRECFLKEKRK